MFFKPTINSSVNSIFRVPSEAQNTKLNLKNAKTVRTEDPRQWEIFVEENVDIHDVVYFSNE